MTVYDYCHIGHARTVTAFDVISRYLRTKGYDLTYIRNITDVDDKIIKRAKEQNYSIDELTDVMIAAMQEDFGRLGNQEPDQEPRARNHIDGMITMIEQLIAKGYAYVPGNGDVYYRIKAFKNYGKLSGRVLDELEAGARIEVDESKENPLDFVLWKGVKSGEPSWPSPWGAGRPGWHIECSVMSKYCLGESLDIHGGGADLTFPHHENEIAQSEAANDCTFSATWMHTGAIRVCDLKMSKSLGNFLTIRDVLERHHFEAVRYFLIASHYRSPINYSDECLVKARRSLTRLYNALDSVHLSESPKNSVFKDRFFAAMDDDFNTPEALAVLFDLARHIYRLKKENLKNSDVEVELATQAALLKHLGGILGLLQNDPASLLKSGVDIDEAWIADKIKERAAAKKAKNFALADAVRDELAEKGIELRDTRDGTTWQCR